MSRGGRRRTLLEFFRPATRDAVEMEIRHHIQERADRLVGQGWDPDEAWREAERRFGDVERYRNELVAAGTTEDGRRWIVETLDTLRQDVRYALRGIGRNPGFAGTLITTLALGIGATGAIFSVIDAVLLRPLPYQEPERLASVELWIGEREFSTPMLMADQVDPWTEGADFFQSVAFHEHVSLLRTDGPEPEQLSAITVSPNLDEVLGVEMARGRAFAVDDADPGARTVILSHPYWSRLGSDPDIVGREMRLDGELWTVVGVLPRGFKFPVAGTSDLWIPLARDRTAAGKPQSRLEVVGRLATGVSLDEAQERADVLGAALSQSQTHRLGWDTRLARVTDWRANDDTARGLWMAGAAVGLMFLIALVNGVNLLLVRANQRAAEVGVRRALGASRSRLFGQVLMETLVLALVGGIVATALAWLSVEGIRIIAPTEITFGMVHDFGLETRALGVVFGTAAGAGLLVGLLPALAMARSGARGAGPARAIRDDRRSGRIRSGLVALEVAVSVVLLVGAGLFLRSFAAMSGVDLGMDADRLAIASVTLPETRYPTPSDRGAFTVDLLERLRELPNVSSAVVSQGIPPEGGGVSFGSTLYPEGDDPIPGEYIIPFNRVEPGYLATLGTQLVHGRGLELTDVETRGVVIDGDLSRQLFGTERAAGRRFRTSDDDDWLTVVGVVEELRLGGPDDRIGAGAILYGMDPAEPEIHLTFVLRTTADPESLLPLMRSAVLDLDNDLPVRTLQTAEQFLSEELTRPRFLVLVISVLAAVALVLAAVGLFGVLAYAVSQRRREMGIRLALGASLGRVRGGVLRWGLGLALLGTVAGLLVATLLDDMVGSLLFEVSPGDPLTSGAVALTMLAVAALACWLPARWSTRVDPVEVLKAE